MKQRLKYLSVFAAAVTAPACDLCAINNATAARSESTGLVFTIAEQFIYARDAQLHSEPVDLFFDEYLNTSATHIIPGYNFSRDFGLSLNVPILRKEYRYYKLGDFDSTPGKSEGLGDISLVARWTPWSIQKMTHSVRFNLMGGVKFPTGDTRWVAAEVAEEQFLDSIYGPGHDHTFSAVHFHQLALGSGSFDGVFGATFNARWKRGFASGEAQYYLRTHGEGDFKFGDTLMLSGGPGYYLVISEAFTLNLQGVFRFENTEKSQFGSKPALQTGMREIYAGPDVGFTFGPHFAGKVGADLPIDIRNPGLQIVPNWRVHGSFTWSF